MPRPETGPSLEEVYDLLYQLGLKAKSTAFFQLAYAVRLGAKHPQRLLVMQWVYPEIARCYHTDARMVERNIRRLSITAWKNAPDRLCKMAGEDLSAAPLPARFVSILALQLRKGSAA